MRVALCCSALCCIATTVPFGVALFSYGAVKGHARRSTRPKNTCHGSYSHSNSGYPCLTFAHNNAPYSCDSLVHSSSHSSNDMWLYTLFFECHMIIHLILRMPYDYAPYSSNASTPFRRSSQDSYPPQERGAVSHSLHSEAPTPTVPGGGCVGHSSAMPCHAVSTRDGD